jgi:hypothetical protein
MSSTASNTPAANSLPLRDTKASDVVPYKQRLDQDGRWALSEGSLFFEGKGKVQEALRRITKRLNELGIPYAVAGGMAMFQHGYRRFTEDVDILVTSEGLKQIHDALEGLGYLPPFAGSKKLRDTDAGVQIDFLITGQYPGDGKPKPVAFPDPALVSADIGEMRVVGLPTLVQLKIASGITGAGRRKDLGDAQELIKHFRLSADFAQQLDPYVREVYLQLWKELEASGPSQREIE